jgi:RNA polymerase sigma-70 factor (ECF subfamily)
VLAELAPSPVLELSRAAAVAIADGPAAGLELVADLEAPGALRGRTAEAATSYREGLELAAVDAEPATSPTAEPPKPGHRQTWSPQSVRRK